MRVRAQRCSTGPNSHEQSAEQSSAQAADRRSGRYRVRSPRFSGWGLELAVDVDDGHLAVRGLECSAEESLMLGAVMAGESCVVGRELDNDDSVEVHAFTGLMRSDAHQGDPERCLTRHDDTFCPYLVGRYDDVADMLLAGWRAGHRAIILDIPTSEEDLEHTAVVFERVRSLVAAG